MSSGSRGPRWNSKWMYDQVHLVFLAPTSGALFVDCADYDSAGDICGDGGLSLLQCKLPSFDFDHRMSLIFVDKCTFKGGRGVPLLSPPHLNQSYTK